MSNGPEPPQHVCVSTRTGFTVFGYDAIEQSIGARFERQVGEHAGCLALRTRADRLTYADLNGEANRIAAAILGARGVGPEPVALLFEQGASLIGAILAVLKTGKAYVPLDPTFPSARLAVMLEESGAELVLADEASLETASSLAGGERLLLPVVGGPGPDPGNPVVDVGPDTVAYIFQTSGSTGPPKGVYDTHRNVLHNVLRYTNSLRIRPDDRLTLLQSCSFSGSVSSLFCALLNGAATFPFDIRREGPRPLAEWLREERITMYHSVPTIFRSFLSGDARFPDVRCIRLEGDRSSRADVDLYRRHFEPGCVLVNGLGATETGIARQFFIDHETRVDDGVLPVGYPVRDVDVFLLDEAGDEVEVGQVGEIAVRSAYLAPGYWRRQDLTEAAFHPDPGGGRRRVYRTGDTGRMRVDGCLEYLGRTDFVLKVRGSRIAPAEIESALLGLPDVEEAVVTTVEGDEDEVQLVAYLVLVPGAGLSPTMLRRRLAETLPEYMIPSRFMRLDVLPLDPNGKIDRLSLPQPTLPERRTGIGNSPRGSLEERITRLFEDVLGLERIGIDESFFDLGGDSLAAAEICAQLGSATGRDLPAATLLRAPTVAELARLLSSTDGPVRIPDLVPIQSEGARAPFFLVSDEVGPGYYADLARHLGNDQPVWGLQSMTGVDRIPTLATRYLTEIRAVQPSGPYRLGGWCYCGVVAFEVAHQLREVGEEVELLALLGISAYDFPQLVSPAAWRRYRRSHGFVGLVRGHLARARALRAGEGARYIMHKGRRVAPYLWGRLALRVPALLRHLPHSRTDAGGVPDTTAEAFALYSPRPFPGRVTLFLAEGETATYSSDPSADWRRLALVEVDVHLVPGDHDAMLAEPQIREVARLLTESLRGAG